ncbi:MAG: hypothetical protein WEA99_00590 [Brumimicrobium sp.]
MKVYPDLEKHYFGDSINQRNGLFFFVVYVFKEIKHINWVDRIIQEEMKFKPIINWTTMEKESDYLRIINHARSLTYKGESIAEWELVNFKGNTSI